MPALSPYAKRNFDPGHRTLVNPNYGTLGDARGRMIFEFCPVPTNVVLAAGQLLPFAQSRETLKLGTATMTPVQKVPGPVMLQANQPGVNTAAVVAAQKAGNAPRWGS